MSETQLTDEAIQSVAELAQAAQKAELFTVPSEHPAIWYTTKTDGTVQRHYRTPQPRNHRATRLVDVRRFVADHLVDFAGAVDDARGESRVTVWCWKGSVVAILDDEHHRLDQIKLQAPDSAAFQTLTRLSKSDEWLDQKAFLHLCKVELYGCVPSSFIDLMRQLKFTANQSGEGEVRAGRKSLGVSVQREALAGGREMPEEIEVLVPVYQDLIDGDDAHDQSGEAWDVFTTRVTCVLSIDYGANKLRLEPIPDELTRAKREADEWVFNKMKGMASDKVRVYCGSPNPS